MRHCFRLRLAAAALIFLHAWPAQAASWWPFGYEGIDYAIRFEGADDAMTHWFTELKLHERTETNPPQNPDELEQEANTLAARVKKALEAKGYMEAQAEPHLDREAKPPLVTVAVQQGARYPLRAIHFEWQEEQTRALDLSMIASREGTPLDMATIEQDAVTLAETIGKDACLLSLSVTPRLRLHSARRDAELAFIISHGPVVHYGATRIEGNRRVDDTVITRAVKWKEGGCYEAARLDSTRTALVQSQLFSTVEIEPVTPPDASGQVPIRVGVKERVARTIGAGVNYSMDEGAGVTGSWEHRNLFGGAQKLNAKLTAAEREQSLNATLRIPAFMRDDQLLALSSGLKREDTDRYQALTFEGSASLERRLSTRLNGGVGIGYTLSTTEDPITGSNRYALLSFPTFLEYEGRDNALDARKGLFARLSATPYTETVGDGGQFLKLLGIGQAYLSSDTLPTTPTLAGRVALGSIHGGSGDDVPADIRYYAGGGGSVRGYSYQSLAPRVGGRAVGGSSLIESSAELRMRFTPTIGGVAFVDAGNAYDSPTPDLGEKLYYGAGIGARYYSSIGPLRADIAFPLNGKDIGQTGYQFYISIGQAF